MITFLLSTEIIPLCLRIMESGTSSTGSLAALALRALAHGAVCIAAGSELSKTVATFIVQKVRRARRRRGCATSRANVRARPRQILLDDVGLQYICQTYERFFHVATILGKGRSGCSTARLRRRGVTPWRCG